MCIHDIGTGNPHAHIMLTIRPLEQNGEWGAKSKKEYILDENGERILLPSGEFKSRKIYTVDWNDQSKAEEWRESWADMVNATLEQNEIPERIDHRSYERQGVEKLPTIHLGPAASQMEKKGIATDRGNINRDVANMNNELRQTRARIKKLKRWLYSQPLKDAPSLVDTYGAIASTKNLTTNWQRIKNLKTSSKVFMFLSVNGISDLSQLSDKITQIHQEFYETSSQIKEKERRINTLSTHLAHWETLKKHKAMYIKYKNLKPKEHDTFYAKHSEDIQLYEVSKDYFAKLMNGRTELPIKAWQKEKDTLLAERFALCEKYYRLKDDVRSIEVLQRSAENLMREEMQSTEHRHVELNIS